MLRRNCGAYTASEGGHDPTPSYDRYRQRVAHYSIPAPLLRPFLRAALALQRPRSGEVYDGLREVCALGTSAAEAEALRAVRALRTGLRRNRDAVAVQDFGAGTPALVSLPGQVFRKPRVRTVASIHAEAAVSHPWGLFLFRLVRWLRPGRVLELGTNLGVSAAYIGTALDLNGGGRLVTIEGDPTLAGLACAALRQVSRSPVEVVQGRFGDVLPGVVEAHGPFDLVFIDGHHEAAATLRYYDTIAPHLSRGACVVFDDLEPGLKTVRRAWKRIRAAHPDALSVDLVQFGLLFPPAGGVPVAAGPAG